MPSRRDVLATSGLMLTGFGGCLDWLGGGVEGGSPTAPPDGPTPTATDTRPPAGISVGSAVVRDAIVFLDTPDSMTVTDEHGWYLFVHVDADGEGSTAPPTEVFSLRTGARSFGARTDLGGAYGIEGIGRRAYSADRASGWVGFLVPSSLGAETATVSCGDAAWELPTDVLDRLNGPTPSWTVEEIVFPDELGAGERFEMSVTVRNTGSVYGTFRGVLNVADLRYAYYPYPFAEAAEPGEVATFTHSDTVPEDAQNPSFYFRTQAGDESRSYEVRTSGSDE